MVEDEDIYEKKKLSDGDRNRALKELCIFALVAFCLYLTNLLLPYVLRFIINLIHSL